MSVCRQLRNVLSEEVIRELAGDSHAMEELEAEWKQLCDDRVALREVCYMYHHTRPTTAVVFHCSPHLMRLSIVLPDLSKRRYEDCSSL